MPPCRLAHRVCGVPLLKRNTLFQNSWKGFDAWAGGSAEREKDTSMIIRVFCARLKPGMWAAFERLCREKSVPAMQTMPGFLTYQIGLPRADRPNDFVFVSLWVDRASIQAF